MNLTTQYTDIDNTLPLEQRIENAIARAQQKITVESALVSLKQTKTSSFPFSAQIRIETPGPDIHVTGNGYTAESALRKAETLLVSACRHKELRRKNRKKTPRDVSVRK